MTALRLLAIAVTTTCLLSGCKRPEVSLERSQPSETKPTANLEGVWRSVSSDMALQVLPEGKADFYPGKDDHILPATFTNASGRLRLDVAAPLSRKVVNFVVKGDHLEHEESGALFYREEEFLKRWLGARFADTSSIAVPDPNERFRVSSDKGDEWNPEAHSFGTVYLDRLNKMVNDKVILQSVTLHFKDGNTAWYSCTLDPGTASLPRAKHIRKGLIAFQWGSYEVRSIKAVAFSKTDSDIKEITGTYKYVPNALGERVLALREQIVRDAYKFRVQVTPPRTIAKQPWLNAWDWGYTDKPDYETKNIK